MRLRRRQRPEADAAGPSAPQARVTVDADGKVTIDVRDDRALRCVNCGSQALVDDYDAVSRHLTITCPSCGFTTSKKVPRTS